MFAYHHGKNCTDSDSIDNNVNSTVDKSITLSTLQPTNLSQFSTKSIVDHEKHITTTSVDFETVSNRENMPFQRSYSDRLYHDDQSTDTALIRCELCRKSIEWQLFEEHINLDAEQDRERRAKNTIEDLDNDDDDDHRRREQEEVSHYDGIKLVYFISTTSKSKCD
ncbi:unnamed protein product [Rotaria sordida]|uniref:Uncharacterized protein n=1 Tax=Rotaria sordida TaxID=392033 RepID=A0A819NLS3_9BILA|nr:unnamed protein product [Rotaria sordida]